MANSPSSTPNSTSGHGPTSGSGLSSLATPAKSLKLNLNNFDLSGLSTLPKEANRAAIYGYLAKLALSGASAAIIQYTENEKTRDIARFCRDGIQKIDNPIHIQSTTKSIFTLFLIDVMGQELWDNLDKPVSKLVKADLAMLCPLRKLPEFKEATEFPTWWNCSLRDLLNHSSGLAFNEDQAVEESKISTNPNNCGFTRYSNIAVEVAAVTLMQWMRENPEQFGKTSLTEQDLVNRAQDFLAKNFHYNGQPPPLFSLYQPPPLFSHYPLLFHITMSGKITATAQQIAQLPHIVQGLDRDIIKKLLTPIGEVPGYENFRNGLEPGSPFPELQTPWAKAYWGENLEPNVISNLFFRRSYGYGTWGSYENTCDVVIKDFDPNKVADSVKNNSFFTVVRLQSEEAGEEAKKAGRLTATYGHELRKVLADFF